MSYQKLRKLFIAPSVVRDFYQPYAETGNKTVDLFQEFTVIGLDLLIHNRGAASLTVSLDKSTAITVEAGDIFTMDNCKYALVEVTSAVAYDMIVQGIHLTEEMKKVLLLGK